VFTFEATIIGARYYYINCLRHLQTVISRPLSFMILTYIAWCLSLIFHVIKVVWKHCYFLSVI